MTAEDETLIKISEFVQELKASLHLRFQPSSTISPQTRPSLNGVPK